MVFLPGLVVDSPNDPQYLGAEVANSMTAENCAAYGCPMAFIGDERVAAAHQY